MAYEREKELLWIAVSTLYGVVVATADAQADVARLRLAQNSLKDELPCKFEFRKSPWDPQNEIWVVKMTKRAPAPAQAQGDAPPPAIADINSIDDLGL